MSRTPKQEAPSVGARVTLSLGGRDIVATVVEDRGPIGVGGRQLLRVRVELTGGAEPIEFEVPAADARVAA